MCRVRHVISPVCHDVRTLLSAPLTKMVSPTNGGGSDPVHPTSEQEVSSSLGAPPGPSSSSHPPALTIRIGDVERMPVLPEVSASHNASQSDEEEPQDTAVTSAVFSPGSEATLCSPNVGRQPMRLDLKASATPIPLHASHETSPELAHKEIPGLARAVPIQQAIAPYCDDPNYDEELHYECSDEARVVKILDSRFMSFILLALFTLSMDRTNHSNAIADNLPDDLGVDAPIVNIAALLHASFFFVFSLVGAVIAKKVGPARWIPILVFSWGAITIGHAFIRNTHDYLFVRSGVAITEAGVIPAILVYLGRFYTTTEFATRLAWMWGIQMLGSAASGLIATGLLRLRGVLGLSGWRWLFLTNGIITVLVGISSWFYFPREAARTAGGLRGRKPWFTPFQVKIAVTRIIRNDPAKRFMSRPVTWKDVYNTFTDVGIWLHIMNTTIGLTPLTPLHIYFPLTIRAFEFEVFTANALTVPPFIIQAVSTILLIRHSDKVRERGFHGAFGAGWMLLGWVLLLVLPHDTSPVARYLAALVVASWPAVHPLNVAWMSENVGSVGKRTVATGAMSGFAAIHGTWGSQIYRVGDYPDFRRGNKLNVIFAGTAMFMWLSQKLYYRRKNALNAARCANMGPEQRSREESQQWLKGNKSILFRFRD